MTFRTYFGKRISIVAISILVGSGAGSVFAAGSDWSLATAADRAGDALTIGAAPPHVTTLAADTKSSSQTVRTASAAFGTDRAGDALPIGAPLIADAPVAVASSRAKDGREPLVALGADRAGDALPIGAPSALRDTAGQMAERAIDKTVN